MTDFDRLANHIANNNPIFHDRNRTPYNQLSKKRIEQVRKEFKSNVENNKARHDWMQASRRKNYEMEYDRVRGELQKVLIKDPNATSIQKLVERVNTLKDLADVSVNGQKHEIYTKDSTGGHTVTTTVHNTVVNNNPSSDNLQYCDVCDKCCTNTRSAHASHIRTDDHKRNSATRLAREQITAAEIEMERDRLREARALNTLSIYFRGRQLTRRV